MTTKYQICRYIDSVDSEYLLLKTQFNAVLILYPVKNSDQ